MAKQHGLLNLRGTIGDISYYKTKYGYLAREKGGVSRERQATDPAFQSTRENNEEFGTASRAVKLFRGVFSRISVYAEDKTIQLRLMKLMVSIIREDGIHVKGKRQLLDEHAVLLKGFDFNKAAPMGLVFRAPYTASVTKETGAVSVAVPPFDPEQMLVRPAGATHFRLVMGGAAIHFASQEYGTDMTSSGYLSYDDVTEPQELSVNVAADCVHPVIVVLGVEFYQELNGNYYLLKNGACKTLGVIKVS